MIFYQKDRNVGPRLRQILHARDTEIKSLKHHDKTILMFQCKVRKVKVSAPVAPSLLLQFQPLGYG